MAYTLAKNAGQGISSFSSRAYKGQPNLPVSSGGFYFVLDSAEFEAKLETMRKEFSAPSTAHPVLMTAFALLTRIIEKTPVWTGECRANWYYSLDRLAQQLGGSVKGAPTPKTVEEKHGYASGRFSYERAGQYYHIVTMINRAKHAMKLEYGWSKKAPWGMVRISVQEMSGAIPPLVKMQLDYMWRNAGVPPGTSFWAGAGIGPKLGKYEYTAPTAGSKARNANWRTYRKVK